MWRFSDPEHVLIGPLNCVENNAGWNVRDVRFFFVREFFENCVVIAVNITLSHTTAMTSLCTYYILSATDTGELQSKGGGKSTYVSGKFRGTLHDGEAGISIPCHGGDSRKSFTNNFLVTRHVESTGRVPLLQKPQRLPHSCRKQSRRMLFEPTPL